MLGTKGGASLDPPVIYTEANELLVDITPKFTVNDPFTQELAHFVDCVRTSTQPNSSGEKGLKVTRMLLGIYDSSENDREIHF